MIPLETLPPGDPSGGVVYLRIVLYPEESSRLLVLLNIGFNKEGLLAPRPTPKLEDHPSEAVRDYLFNLFAHSLCCVKCRRHVSKINIVNVYFDNNNTWATEGVVK